jgi:pseudaminic acid cytidylyltransferase
MKKPIAIIPARGGSKRLSRKNILPLGDIPLIAHIISSAIESKVFSRVIVSTEDKEISNIASEYGAEVFERDDALAQDTSTVVEVCLDVLKDTDDDLFCCLYATAALLSIETIRSSYQRFIMEESDVLMGVSSYNYSPISALIVKDSGNASLLLKEFEDSQSQSHPQLRASNGTFYWAKKKSFMKEKTFYSSSLRVLDVQEDEVCDIDTKEDYLNLQKKYEASHI